MATSNQAAADAVGSGNTFLGIEFGSTRIKAVLIDSDHKPIASGSHHWENSLLDGIWTYSEEEIIYGLQDCFAALSSDVLHKYGLPLTRVRAMGVSAMMHGYLAFDEEGKLLTPFRTWRNTITGEAASFLTNLFHFNIPQRWSVAHLYQAILNGEEHVSKICYLTTLAGYVHYLLTGERVIGIGDASGMFPIDETSQRYNAEMLSLFDKQLAGKNLSWKMGDILPMILPAGVSAGKLTPAGAAIIDPTLKFQAGIPFCAPEGDAGTGMTATNCVRPGTGNISAGTSIFAMAVLKKGLSDIYPVIDVVTTPSGEPVAMVHCNNCLSDFDAWADIFGQAARAMGAEFENAKLYDYLYMTALQSEPDCGGLLTYNYVSGEHVTGFSEGRPLFVRKPDSQFTLENFMRATLYSATATLRIGMNTLFQKENVKLDQICGHGGFFKATVVGQRIMSAAMNTPVTVMETAGEGGPWGMALLAAYLINKDTHETLSDYLSDRVFAASESSTIYPNPDEVIGYETFMKRYEDGLAIERAAVDVL